MEKDFSETSVLVRIIVDYNNAVLKVGDSNWILLDCSEVIMNTMGFTRFSDMPY